jgi:hypothetical protein
MDSDVGVAYDNGIKKFRVSHGSAVFDYCYPPILRDEFSMSYSDKEKLCDFN